MKVVQFFVHFHERKNLMQMHQTFAQQQQQQQQVAVC